MAKVFSLGADPEIGICIEGGHGLVPAWELTTGLKHGVKQKIMPAKGVDAVDVHADGVALEYNFTPQNSADAFCRAHAAALKSVTTWISFKGKEMRKAFVPFYRDGVQGYSKEALLHPIAANVGCDPDYDAYSDTPDIPRPPPVLDSNGTRYFGGHVHVGYDKNLCPPWVMARFLDLFVGAVIMRYDTQPVRKTYYGKAGIYRTKPYGMEYRSLSNAWVQSNDLTRKVAHNSEQLVTKLEEHPDAMFDFFSTVDWAAGQAIISNRNHKQVEAWRRDQVARMDSSLSGSFYAGG